MTTSINEEILNIIASEAKIDRNKLDLNATLGNIGIDSLDVLEIVFKLEDSYDIYIDTNSTGLATQSLHEILDQIKKIIIAKETEKS